MARKKKSGVGGAAEGGWLVTFSDLITLLLTFFVLLLTMTTMDTVIISRISAYVSSPHDDAALAAGKMPTRLIELIELLRDPDNVFNKQERIKDLLFPDEVLPPDLPRETLENNLKILANPEGVVIVLTDGLLFTEGSAALNHRGIRLLDELVPVILGINTDVNISGHTDSTPAQGMSNDDLSVFRALAVLDRFLHSGIKSNRFSISGYGADRPISTNETIEGRAQNRRVEILLKVTPRIGSYL